MALGLGIDAGGTATRWRLVESSGQCVAQGYVEPLTGHLFSPAAEERAQQIVSSMAATVTKTGKPLSIIAGITGLTRETPAEATMRGILSKAFRLPEEKIFVAEDMWIAYLSYFALGEGILVYSGTGSIGYYLSETKDVIRVGGRGNLIDDAGSGFWIAREALRAILRTEEERPGTAGQQFSARPWPRPSAAATGTRSDPSSMAETGARSAPWPARSVRPPTRATIRRSISWKTRAQSWRASPTASSNASVLARLLS